MENKYPILTSPIKIGNVTFRNRMFSAPMGAINDPVMMENILASGKADVIYITGAICEGYHAVLDI